MEELERLSGQEEVELCLERLEQKITDTDHAAEGVRDAAKILGYSLDPRDESGDHAVDKARGFLARLVIFLRMMRV